MDKRLSYERSYFELANKKLRVTLDKNLKLYLKYPNKFINLNKNILELKYNVSDSTYVEYFIKQLGLKNRNKKFSKYVNSFFELNDNSFV